jgi:hypothetical protein
MELVPPWGQVAMLGQAPTNAGAEAPWTMS